jgi:hypothetical protein
VRWSPSPVRTEHAQLDHLESVEHKQVGPERFIAADLTLAPGEPFWLLRPDTNTEERVGISRGCFTRTLGHDWATE